MISIAVGLVILYGVVIGFITIAEEGDFVAANWLLGMFLLALLSIVLVMFLIFLAGWLIVNGIQGNFV